MCVRPCAKPELTICFRTLLSLLKSSHHKFSFNLELRHSCVVALNFVFVAFLHAAVLHLLLLPACVLFCLRVCVTLCLCCCPWWLVLPCPCAVVLCLCCCPWPTGATIILGDCLPYFPGCPAHVLLFVRQCDRFRCCLHFSCLSFRSRVCVRHSLICLSNVAQIERLLRSESGCS